MSKIITHCAVLLTIGLFMTIPVIASSPTMPLNAQNRLLSVVSPKSAIEYYADYYNAQKDELLSVSFCESSYNPHAVGDGGRARNIFQYHKETFDYFSKLMGEELDYDSYIDQARLTAWIWSNRPDLKKHWTCYNK